MTANWTPEPLFEWGTPNGASMQVSDDTAPLAPIADGEYLTPAYRMERIRATRAAIRQVFSAPIWQPLLTDSEEWAAEWWMSHGILAIPGSEDMAGDRQSVRSRIARQDWSARARKKRRTSPGVRRIVIERAEGRCGYCIIPVADEDFVIDHVIPLARGGRSRLDNLCACCQDCNTEKSDMLVDEWLAHPVREKILWRAFSQGKLGPNPPPDFVNVTIG